MPLFSRPPIGVAFLDEAPAGISKWNESEVPAGCSFWRLAFEGRTFYTEPRDHRNCAVGLHTHNMPQDVAQPGALESTLEFMAGNYYLKMDEVPAIPVLPDSPKFVAYGPVDSPHFSPQYVLIAAKPYEAMLVYEAALRAGAAGFAAPAIGRPGCAILPLAAQNGTMAISFGCKGNRTFTGLPDEELYLCIPAGKWKEVEQQLPETEAANLAVEQHYKAQQEAFPVLTL